MKPQDNKIGASPTRGGRPGQSWDAMPIILGVAAVIIVAVWLYTGGESANPVTGHDAPASTPVPSK